MAGKVVSTLGLEAVGGRRIIIELNRCTVLF